MEFSRFSLEKLILNDRALLVMTNDHHYKIPNSRRISGQNLSRIG